MKQILFFILLFTSFFLECGAQFSKPKNLDEAIAFFERKWSKKEKNDFKNKPESEAVSSLHLGTGMWIRNNWIRGNRNPPLVAYFRELGLFHPDDMSSMILRSIHRKLNGKDIVFLRNTSPGSKSCPGTPATILNESIS